MVNEESKDADILTQLVEFDKKLSLSLSLCSSQSSPLGNLRPQMKWLEYSCHGVFWIPGSIIGVWFSYTAEREAFFFNLLLALILDILILAILKAAIHRKRPSNNESEDMFMTVAVDKLSCPSGHTTRAVLLTFLFIACTPHSSFLHLLLIVWCLCTSVSRVLLGRHYVGDIVIGVVVGYIEYLIVDYVWAGPDTAKWYLDIFRDSNSLIEEL